MSPLALQLLPLVPQLVASLLGIVRAVQDDPGTPEETKMQLDLLAMRLEQTNAAVQAVDLPNPPA